jgi:Rha family phage regulatory protein
MESNIQIFENPELVKVENNQIVTDSRSVAGHFGKEHKNVIQTIENIRAENSAVTQMFYETSYTAGTGKHYKMYLMNRDGFSLLVMGFTGAKALEWKIRYIQAFNEMEKKLANKNALIIPKDYPSALRALANEYEAKQKLLTENKVMKPKAEYFDCLVDRNLLTNFRTTAKEFHMKQKQFVNWLLKNKFVYRDQKGSLQPYSEYTEYFHVKDVKSPTGNRWVGTQTLITPKGKEAFRLMLGK